MRRTLGIMAAFAVALTLASPTRRALARDAAAPPPAVTLADDAYHQAAWADGRRDATYTEWWYFNFYDANAGVQAIFSYFVTDPTDIAGIGQARMVAVAYTGQGTVSAQDLYPTTAFSAGDQEADVTIGAGPGAGTVRVAADGRYLIAGASRDQRLAWDLAYAPEVEPWFAADHMTVGHLAWEQMSWLVFMPRARVTGTITVDGVAFPIDAPGYHDHNWGEWIPTDGLWNWAQFSEAQDGGAASQDGGAKVALEMGDFIGKPIGVVSLDLDGQRTVFTRDQYTLVHTRWGWDRANRLFYPVESVLTADNGALRFQVTMRALVTEPLRGDLPLPLKDVIIFEQTARYTGQVWERAAGDGAAGDGAAADGAAAEWRLRASLAGTGFKEYTAKHY